MACRSVTLSFSVAIGAALALSCGSSAVQSYEVRGVVRHVDVAARQIKLDHEEIPGVMPAMTMSFDVASREILHGVEAGMRVRFTVEKRTSTLRVTALEVTGREAGGPSHEPEALAYPPEEAPPFELIDQTGEPLSLADLRGSAVLLDFMFTRCPGPCPIQTAAHASLQRGLPAEIARRTRLVSITIDPDHDTPERLRAYAEARGADLETWSFLTGPSDDVAAVVRAYYVGTLRQEDGSIDHTTASFLIDPAGRIARRYLGLEHSPDEILSDLREVLS